jgi:hypothetical protein
MSISTMIRIQIQMNHRKNQSIDQKTCPVPHSAASVTTASSVIYVEPSVGGDHRTVIIQAG